MSIVLCALNTETGQYHRFKEMNGRIHVILEDAAFDCSEANPSGDEPEPGQPAEALCRTRTARANGFAQGRNLGGDLLGGLEKEVLPILEDLSKAALQQALQAMLDSLKKSTLPPRATAAPVGA